jgi:hypothetical protein
MQSRQRPKIDLLSRVSSSVSSDAGMPPAASGSRCRSHCGIQPFGAAFCDSVVWTMEAMSNQSWCLPRHNVHIAAHALDSQVHVQRSTGQQTVWRTSARSSLDEYDAMRMSCAALIRGLPMLPAGKYRCATCLSIYDCNSPLDRYVAEVLMTACGGARASVWRRAVIRLT